MYVFKEEWDNHIYMFTNIFRIREGETILALYDAVLRDT